MQIPIRFVPTLFGAIVLLLQPLHVIVEDETSDGAFLLWMARILGRDTIRDAYRSGRLLFRHAGGKGQLEKSALALSYGVWPRDGQYIMPLKLRAVAVLDSDARFPGDKPNAQLAQDVIGHVAFVHLLRGRYIESYVPREYALKRLRKEGLGPAAEAFFRMSEDQRMHFPIKRGFRKGIVPEDHAAFLSNEEHTRPERDLFQFVDSSDWVAFAGGFGDSLSAIYREPDFRCERKEANLLTTAQTVELNALLTKLLAHL